MTPEQRGRRTAQALRGSWRDEPPRSSLTPAEVDGLAGHLLATGAAGLGWRAIRAEPALARTPGGRALQDGHRLHTLHAGLHDRRLAGVLELCARLGIDPLLVKGWTVARRYPERGLRPYGDVDLLVDAGERPRLRAALDDRTTGPDWVDVDLEHAFARIDGTALAVLRARGQRVVAGGHDVLVPGPEDALRLLCVHFLRAGGWRALSLADVALLVERAAEDRLDWRLVLPRHDRRTGWVALTVALAVDLLGADPGATPLARHGPAVPPWVRRHVLHGFGLPPASRAPAPPLRATADPRALARQLRARWPPDHLEVALHHRWPVGRRGRPVLAAVDGLERLAGLAIGTRLARGSRRHRTR